ncbi:MAG: hypothetical protein SOR57_08495 [Parabacteroides sp.]|nr:hypothetical protein [Parabacteroides sp.]
MKQFLLILTSVFSIGLISRKDLTDISQNNNYIFRDTLIGYVDYDNVLDSIYIEKTSEYQYDDNDGIKECYEQIEKAIFTVSFGNTGERLVLEDKEIFDYPYSGYSSLAYNIEGKGIISRHSYSSRFSDKVYVDSYYKYDDKLNNFFRIKELIRLSEGTNMIDSIMKIDSIQPSLDGKCNKISNQE